jgi:hypothetical protein
VQAMVRESYPTGAHWNEPLCRFEWLSAALILSVVVTELATAAAGEMPERTVRGHTIVSSHDPSAHIELPESATYVGADRWVLNAYSDDIELHAFVNADADKHVKRVYWVQFEAYLPSHPELRHTYDSVRHTTLGGMDFYVDTAVERTDGKQEPDSDGAHLKALLRSAGYSLPRSMMSVRFVHLMDESRKELMFIYGEDAAATGLTPAELGKGGRAHDKWLMLEPGLIRRAQLSIKFH